MERVTIRYKGKMVDVGVRCGCTEKWDGGFRECDLGTRGDMCDKCDHYKWFSLSEAESQLGNASAADGHGEPEGGDTAAGEEAK